jgi:hypothetical protein
MAESEFSQNHYETTGQQETRKMLPNSATQNGSTSSHQVPSTKNRVSSEDRSTLDEMNVMDRNDTNQMELDGEEDEHQPLAGEKEQVLHVTAILALI